jgi:hypothetical protein
MQANGCGSKAEEWPQRVQCNANFTLVLCIVIICIHMRYWSGISHSHEVATGAVSRCLASNRD